MPSDLTPEQRRDALAAATEAAQGACFETSDVIAGAVLDALLAAGWRPEPQPAVRPDARAPGHTAVSGAALTNNGGYGIGAPAQPVTAHDMLTGSPAIPVDHPVPAHPDAISAAEARGRREGIEAAAKVAHEKHAKFRAFALTILDAPPDQYQVGGATASREIAEAIDALSPAPKEPDHG